jgi:hypothetical protein
MEPYHDSIEHIVDELKRIDLLLRRELVAARQPHGSTVPEEFRGLVISDHEIDSILSAGDFLGDRRRARESAKDLLDPIDERLRELRHNIDERRRLTEEAGRTLSLPYVAARFSLSPAEIDLLLIAIAPELEPRYETLYGYLQDDVTRKRPSVDLSLNLICRDEREKIRERRLFAPGSQLIHFRLVELFEEAHDRQATLLRKFIKADAFVLQFLLEQPTSKLDLGTLVSPRLEIDSLETPVAVRAQLHNLVDSLDRAGDMHSVIRLIGAPDAPLDAAAEALCYTLNRRLMVVDLAQLDTEPATLDALVRDAILLDAVIAVAARNAGGPEGESARLVQAEVRLWRVFDAYSLPLLVLGPAEVLPNVPADARVWRVEVQPPDFDMRRQSWQEALAGMAALPDTARLADTFRFGSARIRQTAGAAWTLASLRNPSDPAPTEDDLMEAARSLSTPRLQRFAVSIAPRFKRQDLVLGDDKMRQLDHIIARLQFRRVVTRDWGFGEKLSRGKGLPILFTGPSGTGKTMAAEVLAGELKLHLFQIDLSTVVSKYVGETERTLAAIFQEAEFSQSLLFFDEADALFGKRTEVKDAHDRYANIEVNYLLQRIELYEGVVVLASNLQKNIDEAFVRRMQEVIDFPFPDEHLRERIWTKHFPASAPRNEDVDIPFLAKQFKLAGGNIRNAALSAAYMAARRSRPIGMKEIVGAIQAEFLKQGKLVTRSEFGPYFDLAQEAEAEEPVAR